MVIDVIVVTMVLLICSEIIPKVIAVRRPQGYASATSAVLRVLFYLFWPITILLAKFTKSVQHAVGFSEDKTLLPEDEIISLVEVSEEQGILEKDEKEMINSIFEFGETLVREIMVPRTDMVCIELNTDLNQLMDMIKDKVLSRIPVYKDQIDDIVGILYVKDLLPLLSKRNNQKFNLEKLARPPYFVPEQKKIDDLLTEFKKERIHMALVVDEYGGIAGLVTLEDVIEEIIGEIQDEYDLEQPLYKKIDDSTFVVDGRMSLEEINEELYLNLPTEEGVETISGFILSLLGSLPKADEKARYNGYLFVVEKIAKNRILQVRIEKSPSNVDVKNELSN